MTLTGPGPFRVSEIAEALRCSREWVQKCIRAGALNAGRVGKHYRIEAEEARRFCAEAGFSAHGTNSAHGVTQTLEAPSMARASSTP